MTTFKKKSEVDHPRVKSRCYEDSGPKKKWKFRFNLSERSSHKFDHFINAGPPAKTAQTLGSYPALGSANPKQLLGHVYQRSRRQCRCALFNPELILHTAPVVAATRNVLEDRPVRANALEQLCSGPLVRMQATGHAHHRAPTLSGFTARQPKPNARGFDDQLFPQPSDRSRRARPILEFRSTA